MRRRVWIIRGGEENQLVDRFVDDGVIGLEYPDIPDGRRVDQYDVTERLKARGWTSPEKRAELFTLFVHQVRPSHLVVMPDPARGDVLVGRVEGEYEYDSRVDVDDGAHRRRVTWLARHDRRDLPAGARDVLRQRTVIVEHASADLLDHLEAVERGEVGRAPDDLHAPKPAAAPRTPRAPKAPAPPKAP
ncbi:MAG TPA: hypothetical protein VEA78_08885, partial [Acidimicrobiales bacterium]|nr:hypothetical protein [Acidimicrobiales bacterium]